MATDAEIIARARREPTAFTAIFDRHYDAIHRFLWPRVGDDAEDLASEVFRIAFERRDDYDTAYPSAKPWLFGIAARLTKEHHRARARRRDLRERVSGEPNEHAPTPERVLADRLPDDPIVAALLEVEERDREPLLLHAWGGLSYEEVARATEVPIGTVRSRIHRARNQLRARLDPAMTGERGDDDG